MVDMRNLRLIAIEKENGTAWVQAGATLGEFYYKIVEKSKTLASPVSMGSTVGVGGHFSGGGFGMILCKYGLAIDNIIDARLINVHGEILDRELMGKDLFWAIRGGGATSFGVILAWKVKLVYVPEIVVIFNVVRMLEQNATKLVYR